MVQVAVIVRDQLAVQLAAREAARAASVAASPGGGDRGVDLPGLRVELAQSADTVTATASYVDRTDVPLIGLLLPDVRVTASATMRLEPP